uniref:HTH_Tnp_Tc3_2 domain-containing protein n=1 Tax=Heterorhabditis bacteriophora TaxID=37862 RepID=A0A1I7WF67_HETBA
MGRASTLSLHERGQIKVLSTTGYTVKQIADVLKRFRKSSGRPSKLNDCEKRTILRTASNRMTSIVGIRRTCGIGASKTTVWRMLDKCSNNHKDARHHWARIFMRCNWEKVRILRFFKNKPIN